MRVLDRVEFFDDQSRNFAVRPLLAGPPIERRQQVWNPRPTPLDQGQEGACVGFGFSHELAALPFAYQVDNAFARQVYSSARQEDQAMGNRWPQGASLLAGAKTLKRMGLIAEYRWAFGMTDVIDTLIAHGPVVLGIPWFSDMYTTKPGGLVVTTGQHVGGHAIMAHGYVPKHPNFGEVVVWTNSWGRTYGLNGRAYIRVDDLARLLAQGGEACVPTDTPLPASVPPPQ